MPSRPPAPSGADAASDRAGERIAKLLARAGIASRREVERMIAEGRIARDGVAIDTPATLLRSLHGITVDGVAVAAAPPARLFAYHKPVGLLVTERDPAGRPTIYDRLPPALPRVVPVGRLDLATEGLLLLTTDGGLKRQLELPATGVERSYRARAYGPVSQAQLEELIDGVEIEGVRYGPIDANLERRTGANSWIELTLTEGKNREVRRVLEHLGLEVSRLIRTRYGPFLLGDMPAGAVGEIRQHDLVAFRQSLKTGGKGGDREMRVMAQPLAEPAPAVAPAPSRRPQRLESAAPPGLRGGAVKAVSPATAPRPAPTRDRAVRGERTPRRGEDKRRERTAPGRPGGRSETDEGACRVARDDRAPRAAPASPSRGRAERSAPSEGTRRRDDPVDRLPRRADRADAPAAPRPPAFGRVPRPAPGAGARQRATTGERPASRVTPASTGQRPARDPARPRQDGGDRPTGAAPTGRGRRPGPRPTSPRGKR